jgi:hypothetical protein
MQEILVPLFGMTFAIGLPLAIPIVIIVLNYHKRQRLMQLHHIERMAAIERGMEIPPLPIELIEGRPRRRRTSLLPGLIWFFVGVALLIALRAALSTEQAMIGLLPMGVGLAYLIYYFAEGRKIEARQMEQEAREAQEKAAAAQQRSR